MQVQPSGGSASKSSIKNNNSINEGLQNLDCDHNTRNQAHIRQDSDGGQIEIKDALSYQVHRDLKMFSSKPNILLFYEELVKQFGYIVLFSGIFPLASLLSIISNGIQVSSQISNMQY